MTQFIETPARSLPVQDQFDIVVCGGGPAGISAAITAGRAGARTCLIEHQGFLGGVWTAGLLSLILDAKDSGLIVEIRERLSKVDGIQRHLYDAEAMKLLLEELCEEASVEVRLYTRVVAAQVADRRLRHVILEGKEGRFAIGGRAFVDTTGDGDLAALAGCGFDLGRPGDGLMQPMTLMAIVAGVPEAVRLTDHGPKKSASCLIKSEFYRMLEAVGHPPSYTQPSLFPLPHGLCALMINHEYGVSGLDSRDLTRASISGRREVHRIVQAMRGFSPEWSGLTLVGTAPYIGVREGRRIHGRYQVSAKDLANGARHEDAVTRVHFPVDIHSVSRKEGGGYDNGGVTMQPYDIPLRALVSKDLDNLYMAGRCISGDFHAHASYRVTGIAVATGEAAGKAAADVFGN
jgi:hypothetical protein